MEAIRPLPDFETILHSYLPNNSSSSDYPKLEEKIFDREGRTIFTNSMVWTLNNSSGHTNRLNFDNFPIDNPWILYCTMFYFANMLKSYSPSTAVSTLGSLRFMRNHYGGQLDNLTSNELFSELPKYLDSYLSWCRNKDRAHWFASSRRWYCALTDIGFPGFDACAASRLKQFRIPGNPTGIAVLTHDPLEGSLDPLEVAALTGALRRHSTEEDLLPGITLIWIHLALGCNPGNIAQLREEDFLFRQDHRYSDTDCVAYLQVPRIKKRGVVRRQEFIRRPLTETVSKHIQYLIDLNLLNFPVLPAGVQRPLFFASASSKRTVSPDDDDYSYHMGSADISRLFTETVNKISPMSHRTGKQLRVTPRRLRRTFATFAAATGMSEAHLAYLLDHSDLQNVQIYFEAAGNIVQKLDLTFAQELGGLVDCFLGKIVSYDPSSVSPDQLIFGSPVSRQLSTLGGCVRAGSCELSPPHSCYPCARFQPFRDFDHQLQLRAFLDEREERFGPDPNNRTLDVQLDKAILACSQVCHLIKSEHSQT